MRDYNKDRTQKIIEDRAIRRHKAINRAIELKTELYSEAFLSMMKKCDPEIDGCFNESQIDFMKELITGFIESKTLPYFDRKYRTKSYALSETVRIVNKYFAIVEAEVPETKDPDIYDLDIKTKTAFYKELEGLDMEHADEVIAKRVRNNIYDFIKSNIIANEKISKIISDTKDKMVELEEARASDKKRQDLLKEAAVLKARAFTKADFEKTPIGTLVYNMSTKSELVSPELINRLSKEGTDKVDMNLVDSHSKVMYTFLECLQGLKMEDVNKDNMFNFIHIK